MSTFTLEIACFTPEAAMQAASAGAHRIEICDNPMEGGTTPSIGVLQVLRKKTDIPIFPMIRPRGGHFVFTPLEVEIMTNDIKYCKSLGYDGVVIGVLNADSTVDYETTARWVEIAYPMEVTFHRAFDRCIDPFKALDRLVQAGCNRILTSGQHADVHDGTSVIRELIAQANHDIIIMPGCGVKSATIQELARQTDAVEFHASARKQQAEPYAIPASMLETLTQITVDETEIKALLAQLSTYFTPQPD